MLRPLLSLIGIHTPHREARWNKDKVALIALLLVYKKCDNLKIDPTKPLKQISAVIERWHTLATIDQQQKDCYRKYFKRLVDCYPADLPRFERVHIYWTQRQKSRGKAERSRQIIHHLTYEELYTPLKPGMRKAVIELEMLSNEELIQRVRKLCY